MVLGKFRERKLCRWVIRVSILVLMDGAREEGRFFKSVRIVGSFNPCFDGWCSGREEAADEGARPRKVSILVLMDGAREAVYIEQFGLNIHVSILVLMDGAREAPLRGSFPSSTPSFNPCFDGWCSGRFLRIQNIYAVRRFQSLF